MSKNNLLKPRILILSFGELLPFKGGIAFYVDAIIQSLKKTHTLFVVGPLLKEKEYYTDIRIWRPRVTKYTVIRIILGNMYTLWSIVRHKPTVIFLTDSISFQYFQLVLFCSNILPLLQNTKVIPVLYGTEVIDIAAKNGTISAHTLCRLLDTAYKIVVISHFTKRLSSEKLGIDYDNKYVIIYPTVNHKFESLELSDENQRRILANYELKQNSYIISIGRLVKRKGHHLVIQALHRMTKEDKPLRNVTVLNNKPLRYVIVGNGPEKKNLHALIYQCDLQDSVSLISDISEQEKKVLLQNCLFLVHPSIHVNEIGQQVEGFGIAILEALAVGKTAIITNHGGMTDIITHEQNGLVVKEQDTGNVSNAIHTLITNETLRHKLGETARENFVARFSFEQFSNEITKLF